MLLLNACSDESDLRDAAAKGDLAELTQLLQDSEPDVNKTDNAGKTPLFWCKSQAVIDALKAAGAQ